MNIQLNISREDAGRLMSYARERRRKAEKGLIKFRDNFDPALGANLRAGFESATALERYIKEQIDAYDEAHPRQSPEHSDEPKGRR